jgi:Tfp pilus assembly protein PilN
VRAGEGRGNSQCLARALCRYRWVPYDAVPAAERRAFVRLQLLAWSPFEDNGYAVVRGRDGAMAFAWDQHAFEQRAQAAGLPTQPVRTLPETMLLPAHDDGLVLQACSAGVEGQVWRGRQLVCSRWWPDAPDTAAWLNFQRSAGVPAAAQVPEPPALDPGCGPAWLDEPWAPVITLNAMIERARLRVHAVAATLLAALLLPTLWLLHANWAVAQQVDALEAEKSQLTLKAQPVLTARSQSLAVLASLDTLLAAVSHPDALTLLSHVATLLPGDGSRIRKLEMDGRRLRLVLAVPAGTPRIGYVRALEGGGWLQDVREDTQDATPGTVALSAEIRGNAPPPSAAAQAPGATAVKRGTALSGASR